MVENQKREVDRGKENKLLIVRECENGGKLEKRSRQKERKLLIDRECENGGKLEKISRKRERITTDRQRV